MTTDAVTWLLESDPSVRWQTMRDLGDASLDEVAAERARVATDGWGARLLALQKRDGHWTTDPPHFDSPEWERWWHAMPPEQKGTLFPKWTSTTWTLHLLRAMGIDPAHPDVCRAVARVREHCRWEHDGEAYFDGEVEPCINGRTVAIGAYFGENVTPIVERLLTEQMEDGGWNCEQEIGSTRGSFHTTIDVLEGLLEYERAVGGDSAVNSARLRGQEYLIARRLLRRLSSGEVIDERFTEFSFPTGHFYDVLRGLDHLRDADAGHDERLTEAIEMVRSKQDDTGRWPLEDPHPGELHFTMDEGTGRPSRWNTLRALRVLRWWERTTPLS